MHQGLEGPFQNFEGHVLGKFLPGDLVFQRWFCRCLQRAQQDAPVSFPLNVSREGWQATKDRRHGTGSRWEDHRVSWVWASCRRSVPSSGCWDIPLVPLIAVLWDHRGPPPGRQPSGRKVCTGYLLNRGNSHKEETWGKNLCSTFKAIIFLHVGSLFATFSFGFFWQT